MDLKQRIDVFIKLGEHLRGFFNETQKSSTKEQYEELEHAIKLAYLKNGWFTRENVLNMLNQIGNSLYSSSILNWINNYSINTYNPKKVGIIMAGNIPLVGFNDLFCVLISGHKALIKLSSDDEILMKYIIDFIIKSDENFKQLIEIKENRLTDIEAVIATGSNNSARYFEYYFGKYPHIIRKNRHSVAVLNGNETGEELKELGKDIFSYFGLGCRNVSKLYVPENYNFNSFFENIINYGEVVNNNKYGNNYDYNRAIYLMNSEVFLDNNFLILKESIQLGTPVSVLHYEYYKDEKDLKNKLNLLSEQLQCVVSNKAWLENSVPFGQSQCPGLEDYADGIDTMNFLLNLNTTVLN